MIMLLKIKSSLYLVQQNQLQYTQRFSIESLVDILVVFKLSNFDYNVIHSVMVWFKFCRNIDSLMKALRVCSLRTVHVVLVR